MYKIIKFGKKWRFIISKNWIIITPLVQIEWMHNIQRGDPNYGEVFSTGSHKYIHLGRHVLAVHYTMNKITETASTLALMLITLITVIYLSIAFAVFQWKNPLSNEMSFYRDFKSVITMQKLDKYQP